VGFDGVSKGDVEISVKKKAMQISISVHDTGIAISSEDQKKIFEKFCQADSSINRKFGGTFNLTLSLVLCNENTQNNKLG